MFIDMPNSKLSSTCSEMTLSLHHHGHSPLCVEVCLVGSIANSVQPNGRAGILRVVKVVSTGSLHKKSREGEKE